MSCGCGSKRKFDFAGEDQILIEARRGTDKFTRIPIDYSTGFTAGDTFIEESEFYGVGSCGCDGGESGGSGRLIELILLEESSIAAAPPKKPALTIYLYDTSATLNAVNTVFLSPGPPPNLPILPSALIGDPITVLTTDWKDHDGRNARARITVPFPFHYDVDTEFIYVAIKIDSTVAFSDGAYFAMQGIFIRN